MSKSRYIGIGLALTLSSAFGDVISGLVTDLDAGTPIAGVKVSASSASVGTAADGSFSLNTVPAALILPVPGNRREFDAGSSHPAAFPWMGPLFATDREARNALGARIGVLPGETLIPPGALAKASALNTLSFSKIGYVSATQQVDGSKSGLSVKLKKAAASRKANLTWFESYPDPGSEECIQYNGCTWAGQFAALDGKQPESWVKANNICAVHERDFAKYKLKTLRLVQGTKTIDVKVYDMCSDADCDGCCTKNAAATGFLIDVEKYTADRFGTRDGTVDWTCIDCTN
ncbi:MAG: putative exported protein [Fibrobacteres bacterium]|nr:putative exported protein [Fibrobacterota bacterium]